MGLKWLFLERMTVWKKNGTCFLMLICYFEVSKMVVVGKDDEGHG